MNWDSTSAAQDKTISADLGSTQAGKDFSKILTANSNGMLPVPKLPVRR
jgi:hypothetical protein